MTDRRAIIGGDGFLYHADALRLGDGLGYTSTLFTGIAEPIAHHPPGWVTVLGVVSWLGGRSVEAHQLVGVAIGLGVVVVAGLVGRRYFNPRAGVIAALIAAVYPGFWVIEGNMLAEPLGLLLVGLLTLMVFDLREKPTLGRSVAAGAMCGLVALARAEQVALLVIVVAPILIGARSLPGRQRALRLGAAALACMVVILPWTIYNSNRFEDPVLLSTNGGGLLLVGNCPPATYEGRYLGWYWRECSQEVVRQHQNLDRSQLDPINREEGVRNFLDNLEKMPVVIPARFGRLLAVFRPSQTVEYVSVWMTTDSRPIWAWVVSYWLLIPFAIGGTISARRSRKFLLPLLGPLIIVVLTVAVSYGEPRYHTPSDLGVVVLAGFGVERLLARLRSATSPARRDDAEPERPSPVLAEPERSSGSDR